MGRENVREIVVGVGWIVENRAQVWWEERSLCKVVDLVDGWICGLIFFWLWVDSLEHQMFDGLIKNE